MFESGGIGGLSGVFVDSFLTHVLSWSWIYYFGLLMLYVLSYISDI